MEEVLYWCCECFELSDSKPHSVTENEIVGICKLTGKNFRHR